MARWNEACLRATVPWYSRMVRRTHLSKPSQESAVSPSAGQNSLPRWRRQALARLGQVTWSHFSPHSQRFETPVQRAMRLLLTEFPLVSVELVDFQRRSGWVTHASDAGHAVGMALDFVGLVDAEGEVAYVSTRHPHRSGVGQARDASADSAIQNLLGRVDCHQQGQVDTLLCCRLKPGLQQPRLSAGQTQRFAVYADIVLDGLALARERAKAQVLEEQAQRTDELLSQFEQLSPVGHWRLDVNTAAVQVSAGVNAIYGIPPGNLDRPQVGISYYVPADALVIERYVQAIVAGDIDHFDLQLSLVDADSNRRSVRTTARRMGSQVVGTLQDLSEAALQKCVIEQCLQNLDMATWVLDTRGHLLSCNGLAQQYCHILGVPSDKGLWPSDWCFVDRGFQSELALQISRAYRGKGGELATPKAVLDHSKLIVEPIFNAEQVVLGVRVQLQTMPSSMVQREDELIAAMRLLGMGTVHWSPLNGAVRADQAALRLLGVKNKLGSVTLEQLLSKLDHKDLKQREAAIVELCSGRSPVYRCQYRIQLGDDCFRDIEELGTIVARSADRAPANVLSVLHDNTARNQDRYALKLLEQRFQGAFEHSGIGMAIVGPDGSWVRVNPRICEIVGYTEDELSRLTFQDITHPDDLENDLSLLAELAAGKRASYQMEKRYFHKNGSLVHILLSVSAVRDDVGEVVHYVSQIIDITQLKQAKAELERLLRVADAQNAWLKQFAHIVSHNLRSHSNGLSGLLALLTEDVPELEDLRAGQLLKSSCERLSETISDLTEVVRVHMSDGELSSVPLAEFVQRAVDSLAGVLKDSIIEIDVDPDIVVLGVRAFIDSLCLNMITNAYKYKHPERRLHLQVRAREQGDSVEIDFSDNGQGIALDRVGDRLFGLYQTFHTHPDSRGVGLFLVKSQVDAMGGSISVQSRPEEGTTFQVKLRNALRQHVSEAAETKSLGSS